MRRAVKVVAGVAVALTGAAALALPGAEASGESTVVVRGAALPAGSLSELNLVGCASVFGRTAEPVTPMIGLSPDGGTGKRSLAFDLAGGNAVGSVSYVSNVAATTVAGMSAYAEGGTTGVAYVGYQAPADRGTSRMWIGRASLTVPAGAWTGVNVAGLGFAWTQYDMGTHQSIGGEVGSSGVPAFTRAMGGDGAGFFMVGLGCDGHAFSTDAWRIGTADAATTYDFEGYRTSTTIGGPTAPVEAGQRVTLTGRAVDDRGAPVSGARMVLQSLRPGGSAGDRNDWQTVQVTTGASVSVSLRAQETTTYRWQVFTTPSADGSVSDPLTVTVADTVDPSPGPGEPGNASTSSTTSEPPSQQAPAVQQQAPAQEQAPGAPASTPPVTPAADPTVAPTPEQTPEQTSQQTPQQTPSQAPPTTSATAPNAQETPDG